ncbi:hypothetical protein E1A91_A07G065200v1 [Gossypium mustelinum]|uniref:cysteine dioxygenase n=1 Tax=Gossypium mustelinum TaxID=34275 RepID=A0A5D2YGV5_GOSMU|nr:hypothetical protein E1A91_A07G065200v1 [Gossypium mustelinum]
MVFLQKQFYPLCIIFQMTMNTTAPEVQLLYDLCETTFSNSGLSSSTSSQSIQILCSLLDTFTPADVGLKEENPIDDEGHGRVARCTQPITYLHIHECDSFTCLPFQAFYASFYHVHKMCIFCFPTSSVIPLHDHPEMTIFSKVLYGSLHVKSYDCIEPTCIRESKEPGCPQVRLARLVMDKVFTTPCRTSVLYPKSGGNLHCFTAVSPCAVLDVLAPPYREDLGRKCTYYIDYPFSTSGNGAQISNGKEEDYAWLAEMETPDDLYMQPGVYVGPPIQV